LLRHLQVLFNRRQSFLSSLFEVRVLAAVSLGLKGCYSLLVPVEPDLLAIGGVERFAMRPLSEWRTAMSELSFGTARRAAPPSSTRRQLVWSISMW